MLVALAQMGQHATTRSIFILAHVPLGTQGLDVRQVMSPFYVNSTKKEICSAIFSAFMNSKLDL